MRTQRQSSSALAVFVTLFCATLMAIADPTYPSWWVDYNVAPAQPPASGDTGNYTAWMQANYAPATLGQLKNVATQAQAYLDDKLASVGGAGPDIDNIVANFTVSDPNNFAVVNLGQLKYVAKPFYDRLAAVGFNTTADINYRLSGNISGNWTSAYPWDPATNVTLNYGPVNLGQLKFVFAFDLDNGSVGNFTTAPDLSISNDTVGNLTIPDWWKVLNGLSPFAGPLASNTDFGNGLTDFEQYQRDFNLYNGTAGNLSGNVISFQTTYTASATSFPTIPANFSLTGNAAIDLPHVAVPQYAVIDLGDVYVVDLADDGDVLTTSSYRGPGTQLWSGGTSNALPDIGIWGWKMAAGNGTVLGIYNAGEDSGFATYTVGDDEPVNQSFYDLAAEYVSGNIVDVVENPDNAYATPEGIYLSMSVATYTSFGNIGVNGNSDTGADGTYSEVGYTTDHYIMLCLNINGTVTQVGDTMGDSDGTKTISYDINADAQGDHLTRNFSATYSNSTASLPYISGWSYNSATHAYDEVDSNTTDCTFYNEDSSSGNVTLTGNSGNDSVTQEVPNPGSDYGVDEMAGVPDYIFGGAGWSLGNKRVLANLNGQVLLLNPFYTGGDPQTYYTIKDGNLAEGDLTGAGNIGGSIASLSSDGLVAGSDGNLVANGQALSYSDLFPAALNPNLTLNLTQLFPGGNLTGTGNVSINQVAATNHAAVGTASNGTVTDIILLVPTGLFVDNNRDGNISLDADDKTTFRLPFRFWLNDDVDRWNTVDNIGIGNYTGYDIQDDLNPANYSGNLDYEQDQIPGTRDLEDFGTLAINALGLLDAFGGNSSIYIGFKWRAISPPSTYGVPAVKLYWAEHANEGLGLNDYLTDANVAADEVSAANAFPFDYILSIGAIQDISGMASTANLSLSGDNETIVSINNNDVASGAILAANVSGNLNGGSTDYDFVLPASVFANVTQANPTVYLHFEGAHRGRGRLDMVILQGDGTGNFTKIAEDSDGIWFDFKDIKEMYERWTVGDGNGGITESAGTMTLPAPNVSLSKARLPNRVTKSFTYTDGSPGLSVPGDPDGNKYILFVHGWNMAPWERDTFAETMLKRLYWQGYKGKFGVFEWPTSYGYETTGTFSDFLSFLNYAKFPESFNKGEYVALRSAEPLYNLMAYRLLSYSLLHNLYVIAHSHGNLVVGEALRLAAQSGAGSLVSTYVASQAAVSGEAYDTSLLSNGSLCLDFDYLENPYGANITGLGNFGPDTADVYSGWITSNGTTPAADSKVNFYNTSDYAMYLWKANEKIRPAGSYPSGVNIGGWPTMPVYSLSIGNTSVYVGNLSDSAVINGTYHYVLSPNGTYSNSTVLANLTNENPYAYTGNISTSPVKNGFSKGIFIPDSGYGGGVRQVGSFILSLEDRDGTGNITNLRDRYEIMSFAAEPRVFALGAISANIAGFSKQDVQSLWAHPDTLYPYDFSAHPWHSGEFRFDIASQDEYWNELMKKFGITANHNTAP